MSGDGSATYTLRATDDTAAAFNSVNKRIDSTSAQMAKIGDAMEKSAAILGAAALAAGAGLAHMTMSGIDAVAAQNDLAETLGTTQKQLVALTRAAELSGVSSDVLAISMKKLNNTIGEAQGGNKGAIESFAKLGLTAAELADMPMDERFDAISKAVSGLASQTERAASMQDVFGRGGQVLLPMMQDNGKTLAYAAEQTQKWGTALSDLDVYKIKEADDKLSDMKANMEGIRNQLAVAFAPAITVFSERMVSAASKTKGFGNSVFDAFEKVAVAVGYVGNVLQMVERVILSVKVVAWALSVPFVALSDIVARLVDLLPGIDMSATIEKMNGYLVSTVANFKEATAALRAHGEEKWTTDKVRDYFAEVRARSAETAEQMKKDRSDAMETDTTGTTAPIVTDKKADAQQELADLSAHLDERNRVIREHLWMSAEDEGELNQLRIRDSAVYAEQDAATNKSALDRKKADRARDFEGVRAGLSALSTLMNSHSRKAFEAGKVAAIAGSIIDTYRAATKALAELGPIAGPFAAAAMVAAGMANVQSIRSQQFNGGGGGSISSPSVTGAINEASAPVQSAPSLPMSSQSGGPSRNVTLIVQSDSGMVSMDWVRNQLAPVVNEAVGDGVKFMVA